MIDINNITIGQAKELVANFPHVGEQPSSLFTDIIGKYVIVRSRNEGINAGYVIKADDTGIVLKDARRIYYHIPLDNKMSWYEGVATSGLGSNSKISNAVSTKIIVEDYSITECTEIARISIKEYKTNEQN